MTEEGATRELTYEVLGNVRTVIVQIGRMRHDGVNAIILSRWHWHQQCETIRLTSVSTFRLCVQN